MKSMPRSVVASAIALLWGCLLLPLEIRKSKDGDSHNGVNQEPVVDSPSSSSKKNEPVQDSDSPKAETEQERDDRLARYLTNTRWTGRFTITGKEDALKEEYYEITQATRAEEPDSWNLMVRIKYGDKDTTLALPTVKIKWAGETPVITVDKMTIPGMGTFDARVLIRKGQYAGTWSHDAIGGHLFGKIEKIEPKKEAEVPQNEKK